MCFPTLVLQKNCFNVVRVDSVEDSDGSDGDGGVEVVVVGGSGGGRRGVGDRSGDDHDSV